MRVAALVVVCGLIVTQDGGSVGAAVLELDSAQRTHGSGTTTIFKILEETYFSVFYCTTTNICIECDVLFFTFQYILYMRAGY